MSAGVYGMVSHFSQLCLQGKLVFVCSVKCSEEFKRANSVMSLCEYCKMEKITTEAEKINNKDCFFCSDGKEILQYLMHLRGFSVFFEEGGRWRGMS